MLRMREQIIATTRSVDMLTMDDGPMGEDNNDVWDFDGNNE